MQGWWVISYVVLWVVVTVLCATTVALARQVGLLHLRLGPRGALELDDEGPALGRALKPVRATELSGDAITIAARGEAQLLLFVSPGCPVCDQVLPAAAALGRGGELTPYVLVDAEAAEAATMLATMLEGRRVPAPVVAAAQLARDLEVPGTPYALVLDREGIVRAKGTVNNLEQVEGLADTALRRLAADGQARAA